MREPTTLADIAFAEDEPGLREIEPLIVVGYNDDEGWGEAIDPLKGVKLA